MINLGQVFTKDDVAKYMVSLFNIGIDAEILEPCFGTGNFINQLLMLGFKNVDGYEIDKELFKDVEKKFKSFNFYNKDFLTADIQKNMKALL